MHGVGLFCFDLSDHVKALFKFINVAARLVIISGCGWPSHGRLVSIFCFGPKTSGGIDVTNGYGAFFEAAKAASLYNKYFSGQGFLVG